MSFSFINDQFPRKASDWWSALTAKFGQVSVIPAQQSQVQSGLITLNLSTIEYSSAAIKGRHKSGKDIIFSPYIANYSVTGMLIGDLHMVGRIITLPDGKMFGYETGKFTGSVQHSSLKTGTLLVRTKFISYDADPNNNTLSIFIGFSDGTDQLVGANGIASGYFDMVNGSGNSSSQIIFPS